MSEVIVTKSNLDSLADKIGRKSRIAPPLTISEMTNVVDDYLIRPQGTLAVTENGTVNVTGYADVEVNVENDPILQEKTVTPTENSQLIEADFGYDGLGRVQVEAIPDEYIIPEGTVTITTNGTTNVTNYDLAEVNVQPNLESKTVSASTSTQTVTADYGYDGLSQVTVGGYSVKTPNAKYIYPSHYTQTYFADDENYDGYRYLRISSLSDLMTLNVTPNSSQQVFGQVFKKVILGTTESIPVGETRFNIDSSKWDDVPDSSGLEYYIEFYIYGTSTVIYDFQLISNGATYNGTYYKMDNFTGSPTYLKYTAILSSDRSILTVNTPQSLGAIYLYAVVREKSYYSKVTVDPIPSEYIIPTGNKAITENGTGIDVAQYSTVSVDVQPNNQNKTVTPTESQQSVTADSGYTGLGTVTVNAIPSSYIVPTGNKAITENGTNIDVSSYATASVNVEPDLETATATPTESSQTLTPSTGKDGFSQVTVAAIPSTYVGSGVTTQAATTITPSETAQTAVSADTYVTGDVTVSAIPSTYVGSGVTRRDETDLTASGATVTVPAGYYEEQETKRVASGNVTSPTVTYDAADPERFTVEVKVNAGYVISGITSSKVISTVFPTQAAKTVTPTESEQTAVAQYKWTTGEVKVAAIPSTYVGSGVAQNDSTDLTASGATVTVPAGFYAEDASKTIASGSATTPATTITANPSISVSSTGLITATASASQGITPTVSVGYVSSGTSGTVTVSGSNTSQLTTQAATTITPTKSSQTAVASGVYTTGAVTVAAIPSQYITTTDATAIASDIVSGETAYVDGSKVTGTLVIQHYYTGSSAPASNLGANGDIYLQA